MSDCLPTGLFCRCLDKSHGCVGAVLADIVPPPVAAMTGDSLTRLVP